MKSALTLSIFLFTISIAQAKQCHINLPQNIVVINKTNEKFISFKKSTCPKKVITKYLQLISAYQQKVSSSYIIKVFKNKFSPYLPIVNQKEINIINVSELLQRDFDFNKSLKFTDITPLDGTGFILIENPENILFSKTSDKTGEKTIKLTIKNSTILKWIKAQLKMEIEVYSPKSDILFGEKNLDQNKFIKTKILTSKPESFIVPIKKIKYYKTVKALTKNKPLLISDITPKQLIRAFRKVQVKFKNGLLKVTYNLLALSNGRLGDKVKLKNTKTNKVIMGEVIGHNLAQISL